MPAVQHQLVLAPVLAHRPRPRLRSCRRPLHASPASGRYSLPRPVLDRLQAALAPAKNREAALVLAVFLARYWSAPARLGQAFPIDRRALCGHRDLPLTEARIRGAVKLLEEVGFLEREEPEPGRRYQPTVEGLHRRPLVYRFDLKCSRRSRRAREAGREMTPEQGLANTLSGLLGGGLEYFEWRRAARTS